MTLPQLSHILKHLHYSQRNGCLSAHGPYGSQDHIQGMPSSPGQFQGGCWGWSDYQAFIRGHSGCGGWFCSQKCISSTCSVYCLCISHEVISHQAKWHVENSFLSKQH